MKFAFSTIASSLFVYWLVCIAGVRSFIVFPDDLTSLLQLTYSMIPPIRKGTDSRIGIGFRVGRNLDFQLQFEIGPQQYTQPLGDNTNTTVNLTRPPKKRRLPKYPKAAIESNTVKVNSNPRTLSSRWLNWWRTRATGDVNQEITNVETPLASVAFNEDTTNRFAKDPTKSIRYNYNITKYPQGRYRARFSSQRRCNDNGRH